MKKLFTNAQKPNPTNLKPVLKASLFSLFTLLVYGISITNLLAQPTKEWDRTLGGADLEMFRIVKQTADGGYILGGSSASNASGDKTENNVDVRGWVDYWVVKLDATGNKQWDRTIGGSGGDFFEDLQQTADGGYILGGESNSPASGDKSENTSGVSDYWIVKLDAAGNIQWEETIGGNDGDRFLKLQQTTDGGYILGGWSLSNASGDKSENVKGNSGAEDYWVVKLSPTGVKEWDKTIGSPNADRLSSLQQTADGGYILGGNSFSEAGFDKSESSRGGEDYWVVKLNATGAKEWDKTIGGDNADFLYHLQQTTDGGYILGGTSSSNANGDKSQNSRGFEDYWVVKLNATGTKEWDRTFGGSSSENLRYVQQTTDGGFILGGTSSLDAGGDKTENSRGSGDYWIIKLNSAGTKEWDKTIGGGNFDALYSVRQTADGGFILGGDSGSDASGDKSENSRGQSDYWVVKLRANTTPPAGTCNLALTTKVIQAEPWYGASGPFMGAGAIDLTVTGGTAPYTYRWNAGVSSQDLGLASPGLYSVTVTDAKNCTAMTTVYVGRKNSPLTLSTSHLNPSVAGGQDGSIDLSVIGGNGPYIFSWSNGATTEDLTNLAAGNYSVTVTDSQGGTATTTVTVSAPNQPLTLTVAHQAASGGGADDGFIDLTVNGGVGPYTYLWNAGARSEDLTRVVAGFYFVTVTDANGNTASLGVQVGTADPNQVLTAKNPTLLNDLERAGINLIAYPNPATDRATISFSVVKAGAYQLDLYDIRGAKVKNIATGKAQANQALDLEIYVNNYAKGIYLLKLITDEGISAKRLLIGK